MSSNNTTTMTWHSVCRGAGGVDRPPRRPARGCGGASGHHDPDVHERLLRMRAPPGCWRFERAAIPTEWCGWTHVSVFVGCPIQDEARLRREKVARQRQQVNPAPCPSTLAHNPRSPASHPHPSCPTPLAPGSGVAHHTCSHQLTPIAPVAPRPRLSPPVFPVHPSLLAPCPRFLRPRPPPLAYYHLHR